MGTGIVAILFFNFSIIYTDAAGILRPLSVIFYIGNVILFGILLLMTILRYLLYPKLFVMMVSDPGQAMYLGTFPMGFATIITMTVNIAVPDLGDAWIGIAYAFWWIDVVVSMGTALTIPWLLQVRHHGIVDLEKMTAGWLLPIVAPIVAAATGGVLASVQEPDDALVTILTCYAILGTGLSTALVVIAIYFLRVATKKLPPIEHMVSVFLPLGPLGQGGFAAQKLGEQALRVFPLTNTFPAAQNAGEILYVIGFVVAITLWGFGLLWLFFAVMSIATSTPKIPFSLGWWAFTFPLGVFAVSTLTMGVNLPSITFQILGTIFGSVVIILWAMVAAMLVSRLIGGKKYTIFKAPEVTGAHNKRLA
ncbi:sulfite efflux pump SSU1 [Xylariaceae sp. FL1019]|nr:sulfite efflux pump SSU1 [Xylariaceae sp. FL1019]